jgi:hypothetical protein
MTDRNNDQESVTEAARSVLREVLTVLGKYLDKMVIVGGWVPELLFPNKGHIGSNDVDLALDVSNIEPAAYEAITRLLRNAGYENRDVSSRFTKKVGKGNVEIKVDLITGEGERSSTESHVQVQDLHVWKARGVDLAFVSPATIDVSGTLPKGEHNTVRARIPTVSTYLCMKAFPLSERLKEKDAYDMVFCIENYPGGPRALAKTFAPIRDNALVQEGLAILCAKFKTENEIGPVWAARVAEEAGEDREIAHRRAFELVRTLLDELGVP